MTLKDARALRDQIREKWGIWCVVPLGYAPDGYFARIFSGVCVDFGSVEEWEDYQVGMEERRRKRDRLIYGDTRSPIEIMIDKACGLEE